MHGPMALRHKTSTTFLRAPIPYLLPMPTGVPLPLRPKLHNPPTDSHPPCSIPPWAAITGLPVPLPRQGLVEPRPMPILGPMDKPLPLSIPSLLDSTPWWCPITTGVPLRKTLPLHNPPPLSCSQTTSITSVMDKLPVALPLTLSVGSFLIPIYGTPVPPLTPLVDWPQDLTLSPLPTTTDVPLPIPIPLHNPLLPLPLTC